MNGIDLRDFIVNNILRHVQYTSHYCEENIYLIAKKYQEMCQINDQIIANFDAFVIFISSESKQTPIWYQQLGSGSDKPVVWDYHVIFVLKDLNSNNNNCSSKLQQQQQTTANNSVIIDLDTVLGSCASCYEYIKQSFQPQLALRFQYKHLFRIVSVSQYLDHFASDRSHMPASMVIFIDFHHPSNIVHNVLYYTFKKSPLWPLIKGKNAIVDMNLDEYIDMMNHPVYHINNVTTNITKHPPTKEEYEDHDDEKKDDDEIMKMIISFNEQVITNQYGVICDIYFLMEWLYVTTTNNDNNNA